MIKNNQQHFNRLHVVFDAIVVVLSYAFAWWLKFASGIVDREIGVLSFEFYMKALILIVPLYLFLYYAFNLYTQDFSLSCLIQKTPKTFHVQCLSISMFLTLCSKR